MRVGDPVLLQRELEWSPVGLEPLPEHCAGYVLELLDVGGVPSARVSFGCLRGGGVPVLVALADLELDQAEVDASGASISGRPV
ncbi:hypothetical protein [Anaeromyxobacter paludicola]|uniref:Uncharacterized protein n=1 Tax=Anaeromyxobacter paludicola TaxID=2918171 RepID=A0ABM7X737_9BACT|nr:hypothetical protein [Anaeromyxobacter paludicola]BDG07613.1 hypothetical protein AMPC_07260 [Anaeromyxobacter paludicola]